jgi:UDP-N-acetylmuramoyl-tripeptide--D-alanyl-D-alanine ligase
MPARLIAITGSSGKTTVKDMLAAMLSAAVGEHQVWATQGNFNNDIGVPLTLLQLCPNHQFGVIEMGMNHAGELAYLVRLAQPEVVLINNAGSAHVGLLGSPEAVARAKGEIILGAPAQAVVVLNADDLYAPLWRDFAGQRQVVDFSIRENSDKTAQIQVTSCLLQEDHSEIKIRLPDTDLAIRLPVPGRHNVMNALAALAAAQVLGVSTDAMRAGLEGFHAPKGRLQFKTGKYGTRLLDDTYNANPESMRAAIDVLAASPGIRILVMGDMGELGETAVTAHADIGRYAKACHVDGLYALGDASQATVTQFGAAAQHFSDVDTLMQALSKRLGDNVTLLVKGSRFMHMERVVERLEEGI